MRTPTTRRHFLRSAGTMLALPLFESLIAKPVRAQTSSAPPRRLLFYYVPNGIHMARWTPSQTGASFELTPILSPLEAVRSEVLVLSGLANAPSRPDGPGDHAAGTAGFLTVTHVRKTQGADIQNDISVDQVAAGAIGAATRFPSLQLGTEGGSSVGDCDSGYSCAYARNISWAGPETPLAKEVNPLAVFDRLFQGLDPTATERDQAKRRRYRQSVLDFVRTDAESLKTRLGSTDRRKLDEYLTGVRELETRLMAEAPAATCDPGARPARSDDVQGQARAMADLMVLAMRCDLTRVISFMFGNAGSNRVFSNLGVRDGHHQISHHQQNPENLRQLEAIDRFEVGELAYLLERMRAVTEADGSTLLDNSLVYFSSEIEDGDTHSHFNLPVLLAGRGGGAVRPGRHVRYANNESVGNLFISMLASVGVEVSRFGDDGTRPIANLT